MNDQPQCSIEAASLLRSARPVSRIEKGAITVRALTSVEDLETVKTAWQSLQHHPHVEWDFYHHVALQSSSSIGPYTLAVYRAGNPISLFAGRLEMARPRLTFGYLNIRLPKRRTLVLMHGGMMGEESSEVCEALADFLLSALSSGQIEMVFVNSLHMSSPLHASFNRRLGFFTKDHVPIVQGHRSLTLSESLSDITARLSRSSRVNVRRAINAVTRQSDLPPTVRSLHDPSELDKLLADVERIASRAYQRGLGVGFVHSPEERARLAVKAAAGQLRMYVLYLGETPAAYVIATLYKRTFHGDYTGYDPRFRDLSVGTYLMVRVITMHCGPESKREADVMDFGLGDAFYKSRLCNQEWNDISMILFPRTVAGITLNVVRTSVAWLEKQVRTRLSADLEQRIKRFWRAVLRPDSDNAAPIAGPLHSRRTVQ